jgi:hypothetical protein
MAILKKLTIKQLLRKNYSNSKALQNLAYGAAKRKADKLKSDLIKELNTHPVTKEIEQGPNGSSSLFGGFGNLFGFLGFTPSQHPVKIIRDSFEKYISLEKKPKLKKVSGTVFQWEFPIRYPSAQEIYAVTPLTWSTQSWVKGVERGIANFTHTIFTRSSKSRSGVALQTKEPQMTFTNFRPTPYVGAMLTNFGAKIK